MAQKTKIIPFDWEYYQANKDKCRVITSHEEPKDVSELTKFETLGEYPLVGVIANTLYAWLINGRYSLSNQNAQRNLQLEVTEEVVESWVNVYEYSDGTRFPGSRFSSFEEAFQYTDNRTPRRVCTIPLHELKAEGGDK